MNLLTLFAILAVIFGLSESFQLENIDNNRIIGGKTARPGQFPYLISLRALGCVNGTVGWFAHRCGGSIISSRWVLTAAHCTRGYSLNPSRLAIAVGAHHIQNDGQIYRLERIVMHPDYDRYVHIADVSLLRTTNKIQFNDVVQLIPLRRHFVGEGVVATVSGWGTFRVWKNSYSSILVNLLKSLFFPAYEKRRFSNVFAILMRAHIIECSLL